MRQINFFEEMIIDNFAGGIEAAASIDGHQPYARGSRRGKAESGGGGSGCLQRTGAAVGCGGQRRDIQHHSAEKGKMAEKTGGVIAWRL